MLKNIVFLDIDGVLNYGTVKGNAEGLTRESVSSFDPVLTGNLKKLLDIVPDTYIVISSSWRLVTDMAVGTSDEAVPWREELEKRLGRPGVIIGEIGCRHEFPRLADNDLSTEPGKGRGDDIVAWLEAHRGEVKNYVILDDNISCGNIGSLFFNNFINCDKPDVFEGFSERHLKEAVWVLNGLGLEHHSSPTTWFTADTHFFHSNIIKYCNRPFADAAEMNAAIINKWNEVVGKDDLVWHLGDFCFGRKENVKEVFPKLNGKINLVLGNHDHHKIKFYYDLGFNRVYDRKVIINDFVILSHAPLMFLNDNCPFFNIYGHVHDSEMYKTWTKSSACVCVERHCYAPVNWATIEAKYRELNNLPHEAS